ncbi:PIN domain-containing protein [Pseudonocardiaceae bacterium YIM PH 21723]|nr:PIN domain-containing protein [Pseudonocardiaceae bacterium YIM PH 21723]
MIYFDTSALVKLVVEEAESEALKAWLAERQVVERVSSAITKTELPIATRFSAGQSHHNTLRVLAELDPVRLTYDLLDEAGRESHGLRALDAIHLTSAKRMHAKRGLIAFVAYDHKLLAAADEIGLPVASPGVAA